MTVFLASWFFATSFTWNSGHNFLPQFFFSFHYKFRSVDGIWADQAPGRPGPPFGTPYSEAA